MDRQRKDMVPGVHVSQGIEKDLQRIDDVEDIENDFKNFKDRLFQHGKELFGEEFAIIAMSDCVQETEGTHEKIETSCSVPPKKDKTIRLPKSSSKYKILNDGAKTVLEKFLHDREELLKLQVIHAATQEKLQTKISFLEKKSLRLSELIRDIERRRRTESNAKESFLIELRRKMCSIERRQSKLLAICNMPDSDERDVVLRRHQMLEEKVSTKTRETPLDLKSTGKMNSCNDFNRSRQKLEPLRFDNTFQENLLELTEELKEIEKCMQSL